MNIHTASETVKTSHQFTVAITAATTNATGVDCLGYETAKAIFYAAPTGTGTTADCKVQESSDNSTFADVTSASFTQVTTAGGAKLYVGDLILSKRSRYLRLSFTGAGGSAAGQAYGLIELYIPRYAPVTQTNTAVFGV